MDWITEQVAIGNCHEACDAALLRGHGIRSVLSLDGSLGQEDAAGLGLAEAVRFRLVDGAGNSSRLVRRAVEALGRLLASAPPVLVQCHAGRSRSVCVVAGHLMLAEGLGVDEAVARVAARRPTNLAGELRELLWAL